MVSQKFPNFNIFGAQMQNFCIPKKLINFGAIFATLQRNFEKISAEMH
jgi:hypothetical protein